MGFSVRRDLDIVRRRYFWFLASDFWLLICGKALYLSVMTKFLEDAVAAVRRLPSESQDEIARVMLLLASNDGEPEPIDPAHLPAVLEGLGQAERGQFATDADVETAFRRFDS